MNKVNNTDESKGLFSGFGHDLLGKHEFLWLAASALILIMVPFSVNLSSSGKNVKQTKASTLAVCGNNICEPGEADTIDCPECTPGEPCPLNPLRPCYITPGSCPKDCTEGDRCMETGGTWREFNNSCADDCSLLVGTKVYCKQATTTGCDCGPDSCWDGVSCIPNPNVYPTPYTTPYPSIFLTPVMSPTPLPTTVITQASCRVTPPPYKVGDSDGDGDVDGFDYVVWFTNFGKQTSMAARSGDFNADCRVDGFDFVSWWQNFGN